MAFSVWGLFREFESAKSTRFWNVVVFRGFQSADCDVARRIGPAARAHGDARDLHRRRRRKKIHAGRSAAAKRRGDFAQAEEGRQPWTILAIVRLRLQRRSSRRAGASDQQRGVPGPSSLHRRDGHKILSSQEGLLSRRTGYQAGKWSATFFRLCLFGFLGLFLLFMTRRRHKLYFAFVALVRGFELARSSSLIRIGELWQPNSISCDLLSRGEMTLFLMP